LVAVGRAHHEDRGAADTAEPLSIEVGEREGLIVTAFTGELDLGDEKRIARALHDAVEAAEIGVVVDLRAVTFMGSTGVRLLLDAASHARSVGRRMVVEPGEGPVRRVIELLELGRRLDILDAGDPDRGGSGVHIDPRALERSVEGLGAMVVEPASADEVIEGVIQAARDLFAVTGVGLMLADEGAGQRYVGATDEAARALETIQEELGEGPCVDCFVLGKVIQTDDLADDARWPRLAARLAPYGVRAVLGVPTRLAGAPVGSLNVYRDQPYAWDDSDIAAIEAYNGVIESVIGGAVASRRSGRVVTQLQEALDRRVVIERAIGVLMARREVDAVAAFDLLRRAARDARRKVADVAVDVLAGDELTGDVRLDGEAPPA
jgi:anti-anti-sigma factor